VAYLVHQTTNVIDDTRMLYNKQEKKIKFAVLNGIHDVTLQVLYHLKEKTEIRVQDILPAYEADSCLMLVFFDDSFLVFDANQMVPLNLFC
jgi:hypothetical protein